MSKVFENHPAPWKYVANAAYGENGGNIHVIEDAAGDVVASSYNCGFNELWEMYLILTPEQEIALGAKNV
jgi:hypothetical protein